MIKCDKNQVEIYGIEKDVLDELGILAESVAIKLISDGMQESLAILRVSNAINEAITKDLGLNIAHEKENDGVCRLS